MSLYYELASLLQKRKQVFRFVFLNGNRKGDVILLSEDTVFTEKGEYSKELVHKLWTEQKLFHTMSFDGMDLFCEQFSSEKKLVIFGAGHVALSLASIGKMLEYEVIIIDDRKEFASKTRFQMADQVICMEFEEFFSSSFFPADASYVILTRGHMYDIVCLRHLLKQRFTYIGMIGSKEKVKRTLQQLEEEGFRKEQLKAVHAPIGLKIGGDTPAEIAVSIAAELIFEQSQIVYSKLPNTIYSALQVKKEGIMCTIIEKHGSSPRGVSSRMFVLKDGTLLGTVGGGALEYEVYQTALKLWKDQILFQVEAYTLSAEAAKSIGMVCGGRIIVSFEYIKQ